jgi:hypothetical protein
VAPHPVVVVAGAAFVVAAAYFATRRSSLGWLLALGAVFLAGALHIQAHGASTRLRDLYLTPPGPTGRGLIKIANGAGSTWTAC